MQTYRAGVVVFTAASEVAFRMHIVPPPGPNEIQIRTEYSVVSAGTEGWVLRNEFTWQATPFPSIPGYQRVGTITALGSDAGGWSIGQRVMATVSVSYGDFESSWGAHAALANTTASEVFAVDDSANALDVAGTVVAQVGWNAASRLAVTPGKWCVVYGDGLIGQMAAQAARVRGARVILVGRRPDRLDLARQFSADAVVNERNNVAESIRSIAGTEYVDAVLDSVQSVSALQQYAPLLKHGGQIVYCGYTPGETWGSMAILQQRELTAHFVSGWNRTRMEQTIDMLTSGRMTLKPLITNIISATDAASAYCMMRDKNEPFLGIALDWTADGLLQITTSK